MRRILAVGIVILFSIVYGSAVFAQDTAPGSVPTTDKMIALPPDVNMPPQLFGQNQWYTVVFRGNGEAVVNLRLTFSHYQSSPLTSLSLRVPKVKPTDMYAFQVTQQSPCLRYAPVPRTNEINMINFPENPPSCLQYGEPTDPYNWYGPAKYQKADVVYSGDTVTITLPQPIKTEKSGSILVYYRAFGYAKKDFVGAYQFAFETLRADEPVEQVTVGVDTDSNLLLRGTQEKVNYRFEDVSVASKGMMSAAAPALNSRMDNYYQQIGSGQLIKNAFGLQALESFTVRGSYADHALRLYAKDIAIGVGILVLIVLLTIGILRVVIKALHTKQAPITSPAASSQTATILALAGVSFLSAVFMLGFTVIIIFITRNLSMILNYDYSMQLPIMVVLSIISLGIYGFLLFAPAIFVGMKRGLVYGLITAGLTFGWLILAVLVFAVVSVASGNTPYPVPMQIMDGFKGVDVPVGVPAELQAPSAVLN